MASAENTVMSNWQNVVIQSVTDWGAKTFDTCTVLPFKKANQKKHYFLPVD